MSLSWVLYPTPTVPTVSHCSKEPLRVAVLVCMCAHVVEKINYNISLIESIRWNNLLNQQFPLSFTWALAFLPWWARFFLFLFFGRPVSHCLPEQIISWHPQCRASVWWRCRRVRSGKRGALFHSFRRLPIGIARSGWNGARKRLKKETNLIYLLAPAPEVAGASGVLYKSSIVREARKKNRSLRYSESIKSGEAVFGCVLRAVPGFSSKLAFAEPCTCRRGVLYFDWKRALWTASHRWGLAVERWLWSAECFGFWVCKTVV